MLQTMRMRRWPCQEEGKTADKAGLCMQMPKSQFRKMRAGRQKEHPATGSR